MIKRNHLGKLQSQQELGQQEERLWVVLTKVIFLPDIKSLLVQCQLSKPREINFKNIFVACQGCLTKTQTFQDFLSITQATIIASYAI